MSKLSYNALRVLEHARPSLTDYYDIQNRTGLSGEELSAAITELLDHGMIEVEELTIH